MVAGGAVGVPDSGVCLQTGSVPHLSSILLKPSLYEMSVPVAVGRQCWSWMELALDLQQTGSESETFAPCLLNSLFTQTRLRQVIRKRDGRCCQLPTLPLCHCLSLPAPHSPWFSTLGPPGSGCGGALTRVGKGQVHNRVLCTPMCPRVPLQGESPWVCWTMIPVWGCFVTWCHLG